MNIGGRLLTRFSPRPGHEGRGPDDQKGPPRIPEMLAALLIVVIGAGGVGLAAVLGFQSESLGKAAVGVLGTGLFLGFAWRVAVNLQRHGLEGLWLTFREPFGDGLFTPIGLAWALVAGMALAVCILIALHWGWLPVARGRRRGIWPRRSLQWFFS